MTTETFTESAQPAPTGPPTPTCASEALGWVIEVDYTDDTTRRGVVRDAAWSRVDVQFEGECPRKCCLETIDFKHIARWYGWVPCHCGSGAPAVLCLCEDDIEDEAI